MALPQIIEYLLSRPRGDGYLVTQSGTQTIIPSFPAQTEITLTSGPLGTDFANIAYESRLHPRVVPDAFWGVAEYTGHRVVSGVITSLLFPNMIESFLVVTRKQQAVLTIRNRTNIPQFYGGLAVVLIVRTEEDYKSVLQELERVGSQKMESLASEANQLLLAMTQQAGVPRPPIRGGQ